MLQTEQTNNLYAKKPFIITAKCKAFLRLVNIAHLVEEVN